MEPFLPSIKLLTPGICPDYISSWPSPPPPQGLLTGRWKCSHIFTPCNYSSDQSKPWPQKSPITHNMAKQNPFLTRKMAFKAISEFFVMMAKFTLDYEQSLFPSKQKNKTNKQNKTKEYNTKKSTRKINRPREKTGSESPAFFARRRLKNKNHFTSRRT